VDTETLVENTHIEIWRPVERVRHMGIWDFLDFAVKAQIKYQLNHHISWNMKEFIQQGADEVAIEGLIEEFSFDSELLDTFYLHEIFRDLPTKTNLFELNRALSQKNLLTDLNNVMMILSTHYKEEFENLLRRHNNLSHDLSHDLSHWRRNQVFSQNFSFSLGEGTLIRRLRNLFSL